MDKGKLERMMENRRKNKGTHPDPIKSESVRRQPTSSKNFNAIEPVKSYASSFVPTAADEFEERQRLGNKHYGGKPYGGKINWDSAGNATRANKFYDNNGEINNDTVISGSSDYDNPNYQGNARRTPNLDDFDLRQAEIAEVYASNQDEFDQGSYEQYWEGPSKSFRNSDVDSLDDLDIDHDAPDRDVQIGMENFQGNGNDSFNLTEEVSLAARLKGTGFEQYIGAVVESPEFAQTLMSASQNTRQWQEQEDYNFLVKSAQEAGGTGAEIPEPVSYPMGAQALTGDTMRFARAAVAESGPQSNLPYDKIPKNAQSAIAQVIINSQRETDASGSLAGSEKAFAGVHDVEGRPVVKEALDKEFSGNADGDIQFSEDLFYGIASKYMTGDNPANAHKAKGGVKGYRERAQTAIAGRLREVYSENATLFTEGLSATDKLPTSEQLLNKLPKNYQAVVNPTIGSDRQGSIRDKLFGKKADRTEAQQAAYLQQNTDLKQFNKVLGIGKDKDSKFISQEFGLRKQMNVNAPSYQQSGEASNLRNELATMLDPTFVPASDLSPDGSKGTVFSDTGLVEKDLTEGMSLYDFSSAEIGALASDPLQATSIGASGVKLPTVGDSQEHDFSLSTRQITREAHVSDGTIDQEGLLKLGRDVGIAVPVATFQEQKEAEVQKALAKKDEPIRVNQDPSSSSNVGGRKGGFIHGAMGEGIFGAPNEQGTIGWHNDRSGPFTGTSITGILEGKGKAYDKAVSGMVGASVQSDITSMGEFNKGALGAELGNKGGEGVWETDIQRGHRLESVTRDYMESQGQAINEAGFVTNKAFKGLGVSPDGMYDQGDGLVEFKAPREFFNPLDKQEYLDQTQLQMAIMNKSFVDLVQTKENWDTGEREMMTTRINRDEKFQKRLKPRLEQALDDAALKLDDLGDTYEIAEGMEEHTEMLRSRVPEARKRQEAQADKSARDMVSGSMRGRVGLKPRAQEALDEMYKGGLEDFVSMQGMTEEEVAEKRAGMSGIQLDNVDTIAEGVKKGVIDADDEIKRLNGEHGPDPVAGGILGAVGRFGGASTLQSGDLTRVPDTVSSGLMSMGGKAGVAGAVLALGTGVMRWERDRTEAGNEIVTRAGGVGQDSSTFMANARAATAYGVKEEDAKNFNTKLSDSMNRASVGDPSDMVSLLVGSRGVLTTADIQMAGGNAVELMSIYRKKGKAQGMTEEQLAGGASLMGYSDAFGATVNETQATVELADKKGKEAGEEYKGHAEVVNNRTLTEATRGVTAITEALRDTEQSPRTQDPETAPTVRPDSSMMLPKKTNFDYGGNRGQASTMQTSISSGYNQASVANAIQDKLAITVDVTTKGETTVTTQLNDGMRKDNHNTSGVMNQIGVTN
jgi:hypothetical protein